MKILFYSTNSNYYDGENTVYSHFPLRSDSFETLSRDHPEHEFFIATALPGPFLVDVNKNSVSQKADGVHYTILTEEDCASAEKCAELLLSLKPDVAVAATFWVAPFDWLGIQDARVADILRSHGVRSVCNSVETESVFFDKRTTHEALLRSGFSVPKAVYVHHELYWSERSKREVSHNVYKEYVLSQIALMRFPVVIKDTVGLSSYGMEVARTFKEAVHYLNLGRTNSDRIVEEFIDGVQFGTEIYGTDGHWDIMEPLAFSVNRYGITSPKQSVKLGPVDKAAFNVPELDKELLRLCREFSLSGVSQVDLIFKEGEWFIIEVNPRLSGMTETYAGLLGISVAELLYRVATEQNVAGPVDVSELQSVCAAGTDASEPADISELTNISCAQKISGARRHVGNFKLPLQSEDVLKKIAERPYVCSVNQVQNLAARQEREKGYCEIVIADSGDVISCLKDLCARFPDASAPEMWEHLNSLRVLLA